VGTQRERETASRQMVFEIMVIGQSVGYNCAMITRAAYTGWAGYLENSRGQGEQDAPPVLGTGYHGRHAPGIMSWTPLAPYHGRRTASEVLDTTVPTPRLDRLSSMHRLLTRLTCGCSNVPMYQCTNVPMYQCTNVPIYDVSYYKTSTI